MGLFVVCTMRQGHGKQSEGASNGNLPTPSQNHFMLFVLYVVVCFLFLNLSHPLTYRDVAPQKRCFCFVLFFFIFVAGPPPSFLSFLPFPMPHTVLPKNMHYPSTPSPSLFYSFCVCFPFLDSLQLVYHPIYSALAAAAGASPSFFAAFFFFPPAAGGGVAGLGSSNCKLKVSWTLLETPSLNFVVVVVVNV